MQSDMCHGGRIAADSVKRERERKDLDGTYSTVNSRMGRINGGGVGAGVEGERGGERAVIARDAR